MAGGAGKHKNEVSHMRETIRQLKVQNAEYVQKKSDLKEKCDALRKERHQSELKIEELESSKHKLEERVVVSRIHSYGFNISTVLFFLNN